MGLKVQALDLPGLKLVVADRFGDERGFFTETWNARSFAAAGLVEAYVQDNLSHSAEAGTVRGLHFQTPPHAQAKLVRVSAGRVLDIVVDVRRGSPTYGRHQSVELSAEDGAQLLVPEGFAHGFCTLEPMTEVIYKVTDFYAPKCEGGILWNDPALDIVWPDFAGSVVSAKDAVLPHFDAFESPFDFTSGEEGA